MILSGLLHEKGYLFSNGFPRRAFLSAAKGAEPGVHAHPGLVYLWFTYG